MSSIAPIQASTAATADPIQALMSQLGYSAFWKDYCNCSDSKYCSSDELTGEETGSQYSICNYWAVSVYDNELAAPNSAWISGATETTEQATAEIAALTSSIPIASTVTGFINDIASIFGGAHAAAQRAQANAITQGIPYANGVLAYVDTNLQNGSISASDAQQIYAELQSQFHTLMTQGTSYKQGDALWICDIALQLVIANRLNNISAEQQSSTSGILSSSGGGSTLLIVLGLLAVFALFWRKR